MMDLIPITDEQAKLGQEAAKLGQEALQVFRALGGFLKEALGTVPEDLVGYLGGDWLRARRAETIASLMQRTREKLEERQVIEQQPASLSIALPLLRNAADESREEIQDLWARLLAAAMDPGRSKMVRQSFIEAIAKMDPPDALVLKAMSTSSGLLRNRNMLASTNGGVADLARTVDLSAGEFALSLDNLVNLRLLYETERHLVLMSPLGSELLRVVAD